uniref:GTP-binding protein Rheb (Trinotate prediction) n=1 Tax=Strongyloides papillosus TaxID=174720 RepID=A0A0N5C617_STREA
IIFFSGKTSIVQRFVYKKPLDNNNSLIDEVHFKSLTYDNQIYDCKFADTRGYKPNTVLSYNYPYRCDGFFLEYSIGNRESFELIPELYKKILIKFTDKNLPVIVVGNKNDLSNTSRVVARDEGALMAKKFNDAPFLEYSSLNDVSVTTIFEVMIFYDNTIRKFYSMRVKKNDWCKIFNFTDIIIFDVFTFLIEKNGFDLFSQIYAIL